MVSEGNIKNSFRHVKEDILKIKNDLGKINDMYYDILNRLSQMDSANIELAQEITKKINKPKAIAKSSGKRYVASKDGNKFHKPDCPFAKNIKPKKRIIFKTKNTALNQGYKPCRCV